VLDIHERHVGDLVDVTSDGRRDGLEGAVQLEVVDAQGGFRGRRLLVRGDCELVLDIGQ